MPKGIPDSARVMGPSDAIAIRAEVHINVRINES